MFKATISADIINSTSLDKDDTVRLNQHLKNFIALVEQRYTGCWGRIVRGDGLEFVMPRVKDVMRVSIMLACHVKALNVNYGPLSATGGRRRIPHFGVRIAIGIGDLSIDDRENGIISGEAINYSGRKLAEISSRKKDKLVVVGWNQQRREIMQSLLSLIDVIVTHATAKQCDIMVKRFAGKSELEISQTIGVSLSAVNAHLRRAGWQAIANAVSFFEERLCSMEEA